MPVLIQCPYCGKPGSLADDRLGKTVRCPQCAKKFTPSPRAEMDTDTGVAKDTGSPPPRPALDPSIPKKIDRFDIRARLSAGSYGTVYRAWDPKLDREVAIKVAHTHKLQDANAIERFVRESKAAARLSHPHIVAVHDRGKEGDNDYIVYQLIRGGTLKEFIKKGTFGFQDTARIIKQLAEALHAAHGAAIVHRDVKPANVMIDDKGDALLTDFGIVHLQDAAEKLTGGNDLMATAAYASPEQAKNEEVTSASDQYCLGVVFYEMLCRETPFSGPAAMQLHHHARTEVKKPSSLNANVPPELERICLKTLAKKPKDRYADCQSLANDLAHWLSDNARQDSAATKTLPSSATQIRRALRLPVWAWIASGLVVAATVLWGLGVLRIHTAEGTIILENLPDDADVFVDGDKVTVSLKDDEVLITALHDGPHRLKVMQGKTEYYASDVTVKIGGEPVRVHLLPPPRPPVEPAANAADGRTNLLVNGGFEEPCTPGNIPGWIMSPGDKWRTLGGAPAEGKAFLYAGNVKQAILKQDINVSPFAAAIDAGKLLFKFSGQVRSEPNKSKTDRSFMLVEYIDAKLSVLQTFDSGPHNNKKDWELVSDTRIAPAGTRLVRVQLKAVRLEGNSNGGWFDDISLVAQLLK